MECRATAGDTAIAPRSQALDDQRHRKVVSLFRTRFQGMEIPRDYYVLFSLTIPPQNITPYTCQH